MITISVIVCSPIIISVRFPPDNSGTLLRLNDARLRFWDETCIGGGSRCVSAFWAEAPADPKNQKEGKFSSPVEIVRVHFQEKRYPCIRLIGLALGSRFEPIWTFIKMLLYVEPYYQGSLFNTQRTLTMLKGV